VRDKRLRKFSLRVPVTLFVIVLVCALTLTDSWCSPSMFCVMTDETLPARTSFSTARWPRLGSADRIAPSREKRWRQ
jgi:hypothetical protein